MPCDDWWVLHDECIVEAAAATPSSATDELAISACEDWEAACSIEDCSNLAAFGDDVNAAHEACFAAAASCDDVWACDDVVEDVCFGPYGWR